MRRREFVTLFGGAVVIWPLAARAQQSTQKKHLGVLMNETADNPEAQDRYAAFLQELQEAGWAVGRNLRIDIRWGAGDVDRLRRYAAELVSLAPDVILGQGSSTVRPLLQATRTARPISPPRLR
jgi:putative tryptophan/tyrosine transport system substrate-binding protein